MLETTDPTLPAPKIPPRPRADCRRFTLLDAMMGVGIIAVGCICLKGEWTDKVAQVGNQIYRRPWFVWVNDSVNFMLMLASYLVLAWRLRQPRPRLQRVARQWGAVACFGAVVANLVINLVDLLFKAAANEMDATKSLGDRVWTWFSIGSVSSVVLTCWLIMALARVGRREPGWIDRSGRCLGYLWIISCLNLPFCFFLYKTWMGKR